MRAADTYDYAVIRVVPRVEREEFANVGILLSCEATAYLEARIELDEARLGAIDPTIDIESLRRHLDAIAAICRGGPDAGPIGQLPLRARFHWLTAKRSSIIQTSPVHMGKCSDMAATMEHLLDRMVRTPR
jgi:Protein of unknown function (DUF3037)